MPVEMRHQRRAVKHSALKQSRLRSDGQVEADPILNALHAMDAGKAVPAMTETSFLRKAQ